MATKRVLFLMLAAILAVGAGVLSRTHWVSAALGARDPLVAPAPASAETGNRFTVTALGRLEPESEVIDVGAPPGNRIDRLTVKEGDTVAEGAVLAYLDSHDEMRAARDQARSQLDEARRRWQAEADFGKAAVETARLHLEQAEHVDPHAIEAQEAEVRRLAAELHQARRDSDRYERLFQTQAVSEIEHDQALLSVRKSEELYERHKATLAQMKRDHTIKIDLARAELVSARAALERAQLATQRDSLAETLKVAEARLERTLLRAPVGGGILKVLTRAGEITGSNPVLRMGTTASMFATAEVYETDVRHIRPGQPAVVTSRAFSGTEIRGRVERVSALVHKNDVLKIDPTADADARVVEVRIRLDDSRLAARFIFLQVDVAITVGADAP